MVLGARIAACPLEHRDRTHAGRSLEIRQPLDGKSHALLFDTPNEAATWRCVAATPPSDAPHRRRSKTLKQLAKSAANYYDTRLGSGAATKAGSPVFVGLDALAPRVAGSTLRSSGATSATSAADEAEDADDDLNVRRVRRDRLADANVTRRRRRSALSCRTLSWRRAAPRSRVRADVSVGRLLTPNRCLRSRRRLGRIVQRAEQQRESAWAWGRWSSADLRRQEYGRLELADKALAGYGARSRRRQSTADDAAVAVAQAACRRTNIVR